MPRPTQGSVSKEASALVYLQEELTDARMRCDQLKRYIAEAVKLVNKSKERDRLYEVGGNLLYGIPDSLFKLDKALSATALAASRMDYEELKTNLKPEKVDELEEILEEVRIRRVDHRSDEPTTREKTAMRQFKATTQSRIASALRRIASDVEAGSLSPLDVNHRIRRVLMACATTADQAVQATWPQMADSREEVIDGFKSSNPNLSQEDLEEIADQWEKNKNVVKDKSAGSATIDQRIAAVRKTFLKEVMAYVRDMAPNADVKMSWGTRNSHGVQGVPLYGVIVASDGQPKQFAFAPEDPYSAATYVAFRMGNYGA